MKKIATCFLALVALCGSASASVIISGGATSHMNCSGGVCMPTAKNAVLNTGDLRTMLTNGDVTVETANGAETVAVTAPLTWASTSRLTLSSVHSVSFKAAVIVEGTAGLSLVTDGKQPGGDVLFYPGGSVTFWDSSSSLVIDGTAYTLVTDIATLASDITSSRSGSYALAGDYDASADGVYSSTPVGTAFSGKFEGLGHAISNLTIAVTGKGPRIVGLFNRVLGHGVVRDIGLDNAQVSVPAGSGVNYIVGTLVGSLGGGRNGGAAIVNAHASGSVTGGATSYVGGLVGYTSFQTTIMQSYCDCAVSGYGLIGGITALNQGSIVDSHTTGTVTTLGSQQPTAGGLVGWNVGGSNGGTILNSYASANVVAPFGIAGGLVWRNDGTISGSHASGSVFVYGTGGGLAATNSGSIDQSYATGAVSSQFNGEIAGLVATNTGNITRAFASGTVTGNALTNGAGGLVAGNAGTISQSFASGTVAGGTGVSTFAGGLVASSGGAITNSYALGAVQGGSEPAVGGLLGTNSASVTTSYATGAVSGGGRKLSGGLVGETDSGTVSNGYWDIDTSGKRKSAGGIGLRDAKLKSALPSGFDPAVWGQSTSINNGYPYLIANPPPQ